MRNHTLEAEMAARAKLTVAMMEFDAHIETFAKATQGFRSQFLIMTLSLRAIEAAVRRHTRDEVAEYSKLVAAELGISHDVTDAFVNFQIAMTECGMGEVRA